MSDEMLVEPTEVKLDGSDLELLSASKFASFFSAALTSLIIAGMNPIQVSNEASIGWLLGLVFFLHLIYYNLGAFYIEENLHNELQKIGDKKITEWRIRCTVLIASYIMAFGWSLVSHNKMWFNIFLTAFVVFISGFYVWWDVVVYKQFKSNNIQVKLKSFFLSDGLFVVGAICMILAIWLSVVSGSNEYRVLLVGFAVCAYVAGIIVFLAYDDGSGWNWLKSFFGRINKRHMLN